MLRHAQHVGGRRPGAHDQVTDDRIPATAESGSPGKAPRAAVEDQDRAEDEELYRQAFGVTDPAEESACDRERPPVGRLNVSLDQCVLWYERMARHIDRQ